MSLRNSVVAGSFYPAQKEEVLKYIEAFNENLQDLDDKFLKARAVIVPHAGYVYSGFTANVAFALSKQDFKRVIVIGPSHRVYLEGSSICLNDEYETPLGNIEIDKEFSFELLQKYKWLDSYPEVHQEHSTETQAPFIKHYFSNSKIVEIVYGKQNEKQLSGLIDELLKDKDNFVVISSDLSHFYTLPEAKKRDNICLKAIEEKNMQMFDQGCEACGLIGIKALILSAIKNDLQTQILYHCTSYDASGDDSRVVGYTSALIGDI